MDARAPAPLTPMAHLRWPLVRSAVATAKPIDILEIGCGQGAVGARLARMAAYTGVEPDLDSWRIATRRIAPPAQVLHGTDVDLAPGRRWSAVCAFEVLEHLADDAAALARWYELTAPGGLVVLSVPAWQARFGPADRVVGHYRRYDAGVVASMLTDAGFAGVRETLYGWPLGYALESARNRLSERRLRSAVDDIDLRGRASGRYLQPRRAVGTAVGLGVRPFTVLQRLRPSTGTGLVLSGRRPL